MKILGSGGVGAVLEDFNGFADFFCLKIVKRSRNNTKSFWNAAKAVQAWTSNIRFSEYFIKLPITQQFWIKEENLCGFYSLNCRRLSDLIKIEHKLGSYGDLPPELAEVVPDEYVLCPEDVLSRICENDLNGIISDVDLLLTYPIQKGDLSIEKYIREGGSFNKKDLINCFYQILSAIEFLYEKGFAHRDIKPSNILMDKEKQTYRLIDFDAFHSEEHHSTSGTEYFLPEEPIRKELKEIHDLLDYQVLLDCFALAKTISEMSKKNGSRDLFPSLNLPDEVNPLYAIGTFELSEIKNILAGLEKKYGCHPQIFDYFPAGNMNGYIFDEMGSCSLGRTGTFHKQIRFFDTFDPLLQIKGKFLRFYPKLSDMLMIPLGTDQTYTYFHAPDDQGTGKRPQNFHYYIPKSLENTDPSKKEKEFLIQYGKRLDAYFSKRKRTSYFLPEKKNILWVDGKLRILWNVGENIHSRLNYESFFRYLISGDGKTLDQASRLALLPRRKELVHSLDEDDFRVLLATDSVLNLNLLIESPHFKEFILKHPQELSGKQWILLLSKFPELEKNLTAEICRFMLNEFAKYKNCPWIFGLKTFRKKMAEELVPFSRETSYFNVFFILHKYDEDFFLNFFPEKTRSGFTAKQWEKIIAANPDLIRYMPKEYLDRFSRKGWIRLLGKYPDMIGQCSITGKFTASDWVSILTQQPSLEKFVPDGISFSDTEKKRLKKKSI